MRTPLQICYIDLYYTGILNPSSHTQIYIIIYIYYTRSSRHALLDLLVQKVHDLKPSGTVRGGRVGRGLGEQTAKANPTVTPDKRK